MFVTAFDDLGAAKGLRQHSLKQELHSRLSEKSSKKIKRSRWKFAKLRLDLAECNTIPYKVKVN